MTHDIFLLVYPENQHIPAHWAVFVPKQQGASIGKIIHVIGSSFTGFRVQINKNYNIALTRRRVEKILLGAVEERNLLQLDSKAQGVSPPGVSNTLAVSKTSYITIKKSMS